MPGKNKENKKEMNKTDLRNIFEAPFNQGDWLTVLRNVFGAEQLFSTPKPILLPANQKASEAFELGSFSTSDDRIIGLYKIHLNENVWLERNKVGLRELLRNVYKYDVDGAIVVFVQENKWRLSFISEIKVLNDEGEVIEQATEPKRFTYLLGTGEKVRTPADRLNKLSGKSLSLNDILEAFSVEALNEEFYKTVQGFFYQLIGGKIGKGNKAKDYGKGILNLPPIHSIKHEDKQEFAVRLIGRMIFCWFLKMKKSENGLHLFPESLLSSKAVKENPGYYHNVLERLFFQTLNTPMPERVDNLPEAARQIPFLNGGLFEAQKLDCYAANKRTGLNDLAKKPFISDDWFYDFFIELEKYNFTIDENSVTEVEVSVDPEMLGRIFENLLAEIDPDSGETARKATGSFYTPREIVDYMATESLVQYIHNKTGIENDKLRPIFKLLEQKDPEFSTEEKEGILDALDQIKILDPACGSGAFPMGVLQKITQALQKLDPEAQWWKARQIKRITNPTVKKMLREKLASSGVEYARKIGVIQNALYGVDIQPIAAEISKLRCFLSLMVDENIDDTQPNRGVEPLPNLEFKFVTADTLISLPEEKKRTFFDNFEELQELAAIRDEYIQSYGAKKQSLKKQFLNVQLKIAKDQSSLFADKESKAYKIGHWNPFGNEKSDWFDPKWMFGVEKFDVVIGNPPYIKEYTNKAAFDGIRGRKYYQGKMDIWYYFACYLFEYLSPYGNLTFIATNNWVTNSGASKLRDKINEDCQIIQLIDFGNTKVFSSADIQTMILIAENNETNKSYSFDYKKIISPTASLQDAFNLLKDIPSERYLLSHPLFDRIVLKNKSFLFNDSKIDRLLAKIKSKQNFRLDAQKEVAQGIVPNPDIVNARNIEKISDLNIEINNIKKGDGVFVVPKGSFKNLSQNELKYIKPLFEPYLVNKYSIGLNDKEIIYITKDNFKGDCPTLIEHLSKFKEIMEERRENLLGRLDFYHLHWPREQSFFEKGAKILSVRKCDSPTFVYTEEEAYVMMAFNIIKTERINQKYLTALLNSKVIAFWLKHKGKMQGFNYQIDKKPLLEIPIFKSEGISPFVFLVDYIILLLSQKTNTSDQVSNTHIAQLFEDVIDAMVMELYFKEDFEKAGIEIIKYAERDFESIEGKPEAEQIEIIQSAYQKLREPGNEIRNNMKLMDIKLADIVMPIKTGK